MSQSDTNQPDRSPPVAPTGNHAVTDQQDLSVEQLDFARDLGLEQKAEETGIEFLKRIEQHLGQYSMLELARWFLLSVLRHLKGTEWNSLSESGVEEEQQYDLAKEFISKDEYKQSLLVVLKDHRLRFTLLRFAKARDPQQRILSTTTKAFRRGKEILTAHGLVDPKSAKAGRGRKLTDSSNSKSDLPMSRRAARRVGPIKPVLAEDRGESNPGSQVDAGDMSEEEFAQLDEALGEGQSVSGQAFTYHSNEERLSLLLGALAGGGLFLLVLWLFF